MLIIFTSSTLPERNFSRISLFGDLFMQRVENILSPMLEMRATKLFYRWHISIFISKWISDEAISFRNRHWCQPNQKWWILLVEKFSLKFIVFSRTFSEMHYYYLIVFLVPSFAQWAPNNFPNPRLLSGVKFCKMRSISHICDPNEV